MAEDTITVWVMPHDDAKVKYVVNARSDQESVFEDFIDQTNGAFRLKMVDGEFVEYEASTILKRADPVAYEQEFARFCQSWAEMEMPLDIFLLGDENEQNAWIEAQS